MDGASSETSAHSRLPLCGSSPAPLRCASMLTPGWGANVACLGPQQRRVASDFVLRFRQDELGGDAANGDHGGRFRRNMRSSWMQLRGADIELGPLSLAAAYRAGVAPGHRPEPCRGPVAVRRQRLSSCRTLHGISSRLHVVHTPAVARGPYGMRTQGGGVLRHPRTQKSLAMGSHLWKYPHDRGPVSCRCFSRHHIPRNAFQKKGWGELALCSNTQIYCSDFSSKMRATPLARKQPSRSARTVVTDWRRGCCGGAAMGLLFTGVEVAALCPNCYAINCVDTLFWFACTAVPFTACSSTFLKA